MSRKKQRNRSSAPKSANPGVTTPSRSAPRDRPLQPDIPPLLLIVVLLASIALAFLIGKELYPMVVDGEICRPRYRCQSWSSDPISLGVQFLAATLLTATFVVRHIAR